MKHSIKGITFLEEELGTLRLAEISADSISPAHIFTMVNGRPFLLLRAGDYIDFEFIQKYQARGVVSFKCLRVAKEEDIQAWRAFFSKLKTCTSQRERLLLKDDFIRRFADQYWRYSDKSILALASACFKEFYSLPVDVVRNLQACSHVLYSRALLASSIAAVNCVFEEVLDYEFIQDIYNCAIMLDYGFVADGSFNYLLAQACEKERKRPGSGEAFLKNQEGMKKEYSVFTEHPLLSAELAREFASSFHYPEVIEHIAYHHEKTDGSGFPAGLCYGALARSETILIFADYLTPFEEMIFTEGDGSTILKESFVALNNLEDKNLVPINRILETWECALEWARNEIESVPQVARPSSDEVA